jgi:hypothetical protein
MSIPIIPSEIAFSGQSPQKVPLLQNVTSILGATNSLQSLSTGQLRTPYMVAVNVGGPTQYWTAEAGSDATDVPNGICQAGDHSETGIVWYQNTLS